MTVGLRKKSLLVVDDNQGMQGMLGNWGIAAAFDVTVGASLADAEAAIRRRRFDLALVDMRLVEGDPNNEDGLEILRQLYELGEGTISALISGYGGLVHGSIAHEQYGAHTLAKGDPKFREGVERLLRLAMEAPAPAGLEAPGAWSGATPPEIWVFEANTVLRPKGDYGVTQALLQELLLTCGPLRERTNGRGLEKLPDYPALAGLYWSRGLGEAVVVMVARDEFPPDVPRLPHWPAIVIDEELYRTTKKNLVGAIVRCLGVGPEDFPVKRSYTA